MTFNITGANVNRWEVKYLEFHQNDVASFILRNILKNAFNHMTL